MKYYSEKKSLYVSYFDKYIKRSLNLSVSEVIKLLPVSEKTVYKWINKRHPIDSMKYELLQIKALGIIPHSDWCGFRIDPLGKLVTPNNFTFSSSEIMNFSLLKQLNKELTLQNSALQAEIDRLNKPKTDNVVTFRR